MPRLKVFRLDRKGSSDKVRKHSSLTNKPKSHLQFSRLLPNADVGLPVRLQNFLSEGQRNLDLETTRNNPNKVRVVLKINEFQDTPSCLTVNKTQNCIEVIDPTPSRKSQTSNTSVKFFPFDSILTDTDPSNLLFANALIDPMLDFIKGKDSCIFSFGHSGLGKTKSMVGVDQSMASIGIIPCALVWVFKLIDFMKFNTNLRYFVCISALEVSDKNSVRDLLANTNELPRSGPESKLLNTFNQDKSNATLSNQRELPASSLLEAAHILDIALATRSNDNESLTHLQLIIHLYQYRVDAAECNNESNTNAVRAEKSRLFLLDLGSGRQGNEDQEKNMSLQGISKVILALYTSQRHIPYKDNVLMQLLKETLMTSNISTTMILHISSKEQNYSETLQVVQLAYKLYRMRFKKYRSVGFSVSDETSSCSSSSSGLQNRRLRPHMGIGAARRSSGNSSASSEFDMTSASELSCCETVIFRGENNRHSSDKSFDQLSGKRKLRSVSSESDNAISDKDSMKSYSCSSGNILSSSLMRQRKMSPRTNARAWPGANESSSNGMSSGPELWVDGPKAVYKVENIEIDFQSNTVSQKCEFMETINEVTPENLSKPTMISKETQCEDVWDSGSSITDGSSLSNTLDRKDHRPLSDISECTEETESNLATESELARLNMIDQLGPTNVLDDLLESTFGLSPIHQENQFKTLKKGFLNSQNMSDAHTQLLEKIGKPVEVQEVENSKKSVKKSEINHTFVEPMVEPKIAVRRHSTDTRKHDNSASDSKRSCKSESKEKRTKSKCKKCSRKSDDNRSKSMTASSSTDFSRVASWIENVEYEKQSSKNHYNSSDQTVIFKQYTVDDNNHEMHHHSQPDISYPREFFSANHPQFNPIPYQYQYPTNTQWTQSDPHQAQYSLYDGYKVTLANTASIPPPSLSRTNTSFLPMPGAVTQRSSVHHSVTQRDVLNVRHSLHSPKSGRAHTQLSNISLPVCSVSVNQQPLPPLPKSTVFVDTHVPRIETLNSSSSYTRPTSVSPVPIPVPPNPKCKTLPRDMYSGSVSPLQRNKSDLHSSKAASDELKFKDKSKKESKNFISKILSPFISLRKKINKNKTPLEIDLDTGETDKSLDTRFDNNNQQLPGWISNDHKIDPSLVLSSPYHLITQPKTGILFTESSGHGSDSSSLHHREVIKSKTNDSSRRHKTRSGSVTHNSRNLPKQRPTSSGYGSIIIKGDSEVSSHNDSSSEYSLSGPTSGKIAGGHSRMKHSMSLSNYKSILDSNLTNVSKTGSTEISKPSSSMAHGVLVTENVKIAEDLIIQEKLKIALKEERKIVIQLIETNRLRGVSVDPSVMNLICFKCVDNFDVNNPSKRNECEVLITKIHQEIEQLKIKLIQAQNHLLLITSFDSTNISQ